MELLFIKMTQEEAQVIASWKYEGVYSFYDSTADEEDYQEFIDEHKRNGDYYSIYNEGMLIGFVSFQITNDDLELGLGLKPDFTGQGIGLAFVNATLDYIFSHYHVSSISLSVALFNQRAIKVYKKAGFVEVATFIQETNGGKFEFQKMKLGAVVVKFSS